MTSLARIGATPPPPAPRQPAALSRRAKAAIIVQFLLNEGTDVPLASLPDALQAELTQQLGRMRYIDRTTLDAVLTEFATELEAVGLSFPGNIGAALDALDGKITERTAARLRKEAGVRRTGDPWAQIGALEAERLAQLLEPESTLVAAVVVSKLKIDRAADLLAALPGAQARRITLAMSKIGAVTPETVDQIGLSLAAQIESQPARAFEGEPVKRVGDILNQAANDTREALLSALEADDGVFAAKVKKAIFAFTDIPLKVAPIDVPKIVRDVDGDDMITALAAASTPEEVAVRDFIFASLSSRMAETMQEQIESRGKVRRRESELAQKSINAAIRALVESGEMRLKASDEDAEEDG